MRILYPILCGFIALLPRGQGLTDEELSIDFKGHRMKKRTVYQPLPPTTQKPYGNSCPPTYGCESFNGNGNGTVYQPLPPTTQKPYGNSCPPTYGCESFNGNGNANPPPSGSFNGNADGTLLWCPAGHKCPPYHPYPGNAGGNAGGNGNAGVKPENGGGNGNAGVKPGNEGGNGNAGVKPGTGGGSGGWGGDYNNINNTLGVNINTNPGKR